MELNALSNEIRPNVKSKPIIFKILFPTLFIVLVLMSLGMVLLQDLEKAIAFSAIDDALYYHKIAQNFIKYGIVTYDGITITNGFHPLWFVVILPIYLIISDPWMNLKVVYWLTFIIICVAFWQFSRLSRTLALSAGGAIVALMIIFFNIRSFTILFSLIEAPLVLLIYLLYLNYATKVGDRRFSEPKTALFIGILLGLAFLSRTDSVFLIISYGIVLAFRILNRKLHYIDGLKSGISAILGAGIFVLPYLLINFLNFGKIIPVSGLRKIVIPTGLSQFIFPLNNLYSFKVPQFRYVLGVSDEYHTLFFVVLVMIVLSLGILVFSGKRLKRVKSVLNSFSEFSLFVLIHFIFIYTFMPSEVFLAPWYYVSEIIILGLIFGALLPQHKMINKVAYVAVCLLLVVQAVFYPVFVRLKTMTWIKLEMASYIRENMPHNVRIGMADSGITSYFALRDFFVLKGFAVDYEALQLIENGKFEELADKYKIDHVIVEVPITFRGSLPGEVIYKSNIQTKFAIFNEGLKEFTLVRCTPTEIQEMSKLALNRFR
ncbi:MAG: hypothetical protein GY855_18040 [candidate division Zixibacteria bacterium]|nr:hypothetical protein [candidate division Zixibacteria bacterium]